VKSVRHALQIVCANDAEIEANLPLVQLGLNTTWSNVTGTTAWYAKNGRDYPLLAGIKGTPDQLGQTDPKIPPTDRTYLSNLYRSIEQIRKNIALNTAESRAKEAKYFNKRYHVKPITFKVGDTVTIKNKGPKAGSESVLTHNPHTGYFKIATVYDRSRQGEGPSYQLANVRTGKLLRNPISCGRLIKVNLDRTAFDRKFPTLGGFQQTTKPSQDARRDSQTDGRETRDKTKPLTNQKGIAMPKETPNGDGYIGAGYYRARRILGRKQSKRGPIWFVEFENGEQKWLPTKDVTRPLREAWLGRQRQNDARVRRH